MLDANEKISGISEGQLSTFFNIYRKNDEKQRVIGFFPRAAFTLSVLMDE
jgi:hypothetical protein